MTARIICPDGVAIEVAAELVRIDSRFITVLHPAIVEGKALRNIYSITEYRTGKEIAYGNRQEAIARAKLYLRILDHNTPRLERFLSRDPLNQPIDDPTPDVITLNLGPTEAKPAPPNRFRYDHWGRRAGRLTIF